MNRVDDSVIPWDVPVEEGNYGDATWDQTKARYTAVSKQGYADMTAGPKLRLYPSDALDAALGLLRDNPTKTSTYVKDPANVLTKWKSEAELVQAITKRITGGGEPNYGLFGFNNSDYEIYSEGEEGFDQGPWGYRITEACDKAQNTELKKNPPKVTLTRIKGKTGEGWRIDVSKPRKHYVDVGMAAAEKMAAELAKQGIFPNGVRGLTSDPVQLLAPKWSKAKQRQESFQQSFRRLSGMVPMPGLSEADMGKAIPGAEMGSKLTKGGAVMNPESRAALEKLLWKWMPGGNKGKVGGVKKFMATGDFAKKMKLDNYTLFTVADLSDEQAAAMMQYLKPKAESRIAEAAAKRDFKAIMADIEQTTSDISKKKLTVKAGKAKLDALWREMAVLQGALPESRLAESDDAEIAKTIAMQMAGGVGKIKALLGATVMAAPSGLQIKWPNKKRSLGNICVVTLRPDDTYDMEFFNGAKSVKKFEGLYAEDLKRTFESHTGWFLSL